MNPARITSPEDPALDQLCDKLVKLSPQLDGARRWPAEQLQLCAEHGVYEWFLEREYGGQGWSEPQVVEGYLRLSAACMTTTFVITQLAGACRRVAVSENPRPKERWLAGLCSGKYFATLGISHLTTSRRHLKRPVLLAEPIAGGYRLDGYSPWVTGAPHADMVVIGAALEDGQQLLLALPMDLPGVSTPPPPELVGLSASQTGQVVCERVEVPAELLLAGPGPSLMSGGSGGNTGGLQTTTLAVGLADAALKLLETEAGRRGVLQGPAAAMRSEWQQLRDDLLEAARGRPVCGTEQLRSRANSLVLRASQAALSASKGTGYVVGHLAGRYCREALFFLVWSCPEGVAHANLCELAGLAD